MGLISLRNDLCQNSYFTLSNRSLLFSPAGIVNLMHMSCEENKTYVALNNKRPVEIKF
jgi:hypothetical protein